MSERLASHEKTKNQALEKALRDVETLKKRLADERKLKKIAIHKVDDLLSQVPFLSYFLRVYEYETDQAFKQAPSNQASGEVSPNANELMSSKKGSSIRMACRKYQFGPKGYEELLRRIDVPYTPQHYLEHRRKLALVPQLHRQLAHEILEEHPPITYKQVEEIYNLEKKQEKCSSFKLTST
ncbi:unnamed protein product [Rodentolepis nana]|uniref:Uncharacterized protein n=1 Tax=Rodentolepis nana TaxID=102285 RepID=A0A3P7V209_RODNA|nr:unnamed protein product [Rodentolepis nana]